MNNLILQRVVNWLLKYYNLSLVDLMERKFGHIHDIKKSLWYVLYHQYHWTYPGLADAFDFDHSTILHSVHRVGSLLDINDIVIEQIIQIIRHRCKYEMNQPVDIEAAVPDYIYRKNFKTRYKMQPKKI